MKVIKPLKLGLIHRTFGHLQTHHLAVKAILFFNLKNSTEIVSEAQGWQRLMGVLPQRQVFDEGMPKASPEVLLYGDACSPEGEQTQKLLKGFVKMIRNLPQKLLRELLKKTLATG